MKLYVDIDTLKIVRWYNDRNVQIRYAYPAFYYGTVTEVVVVLVSQGTVVVPDTESVYAFGGDDNHRIIDKEQVALYCEATEIDATSDEPHLKFLVNCATEKMLAMVNGKRAGVSIFTWIAKFEHGSDVPEYLLDDTCQAKTTPYVDGVVSPIVENTTYSKAQIDAILQGAFGDYVGRIYEEPVENFAGFSIGEVFLWAGETTENYKRGHFYRIDESEESEGEGELTIKIATDITAAGGGDVQADWNENDSKEPSYIQNKPDIPASPIVASTAPTTSTVGAVGQLYVDTNTAKTYHCTGITTKNDVTTYTWVDDINAKGGTFEYGEIKFGPASTAPRVYHDNLIIGYGISGIAPGALFIGTSNNALENFSINVGTNLQSGKNNIVPYSLWLGKFNYGGDLYICVGNGNSSARSNALELDRAGNLKIARGYQQEVVEIPTATTAYTLEEGCFSHVPSSAPTYTLPDITNLIAADNVLWRRNSSTDGTGYYGWISGTTNRYTASATPSVGDNTYTDTALTAGAKAVTAIDRRTHRIDLTVDFTTVQTFSFVDSEGTAIAPLFTPTIAAGEVYTFVCEWSSLRSRWLVYPRNNNGKVSRAELPVATQNEVGAVKVWTTNADYNDCGVWIANGLLRTTKASNAQVNSRTTDKPITPTNLNYAVTAALTDANHITLTDAQKQTARQVLGINNVTLATLEFGTVDGNNEATFHVSLPIAGVMAPSGTYYAAERQDCKIYPNDIITKLNVSRYLAYENMQSFSGTWTAYFTGGVLLEDAETVGQVLANAVKKKSDTASIENGEVFVWDGANDSENALTANHIVKRNDIDSTPAYVDLLEVEDEIALPSSNNSHTLTPGRCYSLSLARDTTIVIDDMVRDGVDLFAGKCADIRLHLTTNTFSVEWKTLSEIEEETQTKIHIATALEKGFSYLMVLRFSNGKWNICGLEL